MASKSTVKYQIFSPEITKAQANAARKWIAALMSGDYKKATNYLRKRSKNVDRYCCLGVLCTVFGKKSLWHELEELPELSYDDDTQMPPGDLMNKIGLATPEERQRPDLPYTGDSSGSVLTCLNDGERGRRPMSFKQIAKIAERELDATLALRKAG